MSCVLTQKVSSTRYYCCNVKVVLVAFSVVELSLSKIHGEEIMLRFSEEFHGDFRNEDYDIMFTFNRCLSMVQNEGMAWLDHVTCCVIGHH